MSREYAGTDLSEIRESLADEGFTEVHEDRGENGFDLWRPFFNGREYIDPLQCVHAVVWPRKDGGGYWVEEY